MISLDMLRQNTDKGKLIAYVGELIDDFMNSKALSEILAILETSIDDFADRYNGRCKNNGAIIEPQLLKENKKLEQFRYELYPLFKELNFYTKNKPLFDDYNRIIVLGGSLNANNMRTSCAKNFVTPSTKRIDALTCYRPINPIEREKSKYHSECDTEFGVMSDAYIKFFELSKNDYDDAFTSNRNINSVSCIRTFCDTYKDATLHIYACPSLDPAVRRADTGDCILDYINNNTFTEEDKLLFISHNRYCMRQFLQILYYLIDATIIFPYDIIGYVDDEHIDTEESYNLTYDMQELVAIIDWCERFKNKYLNLGDNL